MVHHQDNFPRIIPLNLSYMFTIFTPLTFKTAAHHYNNFNKVTIDVHCMWAHFTTEDTILKLIFHKLSLWHIVMMMKKNSARAEKQPSFDTHARISYICQWLEGNTRIFFLIKHFEVFQWTYIRFTCGGDSISFSICQLTYQKRKIEWFLCM